MHYDLVAFKVTAAAAATRHDVNNGANVFVNLLFYTLEYPGRGVSEKVSAVGFCLGSGLFGSCNSDQRLLAKS